MSATCLSSTAGPSAAKGIGVASAIVREDKERHIRRVVQAVADLGAEHPGSLGLAAWFSRFGCLDLAGFATAPFARGAGVASWLNPAPQAGSLAAKLALLSLMVAAVELLPIGDDNLTVPAAACVLTAAFLGGGQAMGFALAALLAVVAVLDRRGGAGSASS